MSTTAVKDKPRNADPVEGEEAPGGKKKLLIIGLAVVLLLAGGLYFFVFSGSSKAAAPVPGTVLTLDPVAVNLAGGGYLKVGVALQFTQDAAGAEGKAPDGAKAIDLLISEFSQAQPADVAASREALKADLEKKIHDAYHGDVMAIYYTSYVTQ